MTLQPLNHVLQELLIQTLDKFQLISIVQYVFFLFFWTQRLIIVFRNPAFKIFFLTVKRFIVFDLQVCPFGMYSTSFASVTCLPCPAGHSCDSPEALPQECPVSTYSPIGISTCQVGIEIQIYAIIYFCDSCHWKYPGIWTYSEVIDIRFSSSSFWGGNVISKGNLYLNSQLLCITNIRIVQLECNALLLDLQFQYLALMARFLPRSR